jgi:hypothetical protein
MTYPDERDFANIFKQWSRERVQREVTEGVAVLAGG